MLTENKDVDDEKEKTADEGVDLSRENEALTRELKSRDAAIARLEQALAGKDAEIASLKQLQEEAERNLAEAGKVVSRAVAAYKDLVVQTNPGILAELITGETVEEVNESLKNARILIDRVRQEMEVEASKTRIPAGAPQRGPLDLSGLSAREKIQYAIGGASS